MISLPGAGRAPSAGGAPTPLRARSKRDVAKVTQPLGYPSLSGKLGSLLVFRHTTHGIVVQARPRRRTALHPTTIAQNDTFRIAVNTADTMLQDPATRAYWKQYVCDNALQMDYRNALISHLLGGL